MIELLKTQAFEDKDSQLFELRAKVQELIRYINTQPTPTINLKNDGPGE